MFPYLFFDLHFENLLRNGGNKFLLIHIKVLDSLEVVFDRFDEQLMCLSADGNGFVK